MSLLAGIQFRLATPDDALCLGVLGLQVFLDTYATDGIRPAIAREVLASFSTEAMAASLAQPQTRMLVAEQGQHLLGFAQLSLGTGHALVAEPRAAELDKLYVQQRFTGRGLGRALLAQAEAAALAEGASVLWLTAWIGNARALGFYAHQGYQERGATLFSFQGESYENRLFAKTLAGA